MSNRSNNRRSGRFSSTFAPDSMQRELEMERLRAEREQQAIQEEDEKCG